jgi:hypothetical protein
MSADDILRLHYQERQFLGARDFQDEQAYLLESRHRNNVSQRSWGILSGLEIKETVTGSGIWIVTAGAALDAYGREIYVFEDTPLDVLEIDSKLAGRTGDVSLKVWLSYATEDTSPAAAGFLTCEDASLNTRTRESFRLIYQDDPVPFNTQRVDDRARWPVATQDLPDDPKEAAWPVLLGTITWDSTKDEIKIVDKAERVYSGLRGAEVLSQTTQFDVHPAQVRLVVDGAEEAVLTTRKGTAAAPAASSALHLRTNDDQGGSGIIADKDDVTLGKKLSVTGPATLKDTVGDGAGKLVLEAGPGNVSMLTRRKGTASGPGTGPPHDLTIRTSDGAGGNRIVVDLDALELHSVRVKKGVVLEEGLDTWGPVIFKEPGGIDDGDVMQISRFRQGPEQYDLRVQIGDENDTKDRFVIGPKFHGDLLFKDQFVVDNAGNVTAKGNADIGGTLKTGGKINTRDVAADGARLDTMTDDANHVAVVNGNVPHGGEIPLPAGFTQAECHWIVIVNPPLSTTPLPPTFHSNTDSRVVNSQFTVGPPFNLTIDGNADYLMIGVK